MIGFTSMSKLSDQLQSESKQPSVDNLSRSINSSPLSTNRSSSSNSSNISNSSSSSLLSSSSFNQNNYNEYNLKLLESNFNQIAMAHHSDEQAIESNIETYQDKYKKANNYMNLLFDEVTLNINKMLDLLINEHKTEIIITNFESINNEDDSVIKQKQYKLQMQENLNFLNKTIERIRSNLTTLVTTSSTISGLKQEAHLNELFKITINYVTELKKSIIQSTGTVGAVVASKTNVFKRSLTSFENSLDFNESPQLTAQPLALPATSEVSTPSSKRSGKHWFSTISLMKSSISSSNRKKIRNKINKIDFYDDDNFGNSDNLNLIKSVTYNPSIKSEQQCDNNDSIQNDNNEFISSLNDETSRNINEESSSSKIQQNQEEEQKITNTINNIMFDLVEFGLDTYVNVKEKSIKCINLMKKDSYKLLRFGISVFLLIISVLFFLFACLNDVDVYEKAFDYFLNHVEIKNPNFAGRSI